MLFKVTAGAIVRVSDFKTLLHVVRTTHHSTAEHCIREFRYEGQRPLTESQLRKIPAYARDKVTYAPEVGDAVAFLEGLFALEDPRPAFAEAN